MAAKYSDLHTSGASAPNAGESAKVRDILEYRVGLDDTLPPTPLKDLFAAGGASVFVLSADQELRDAVERAGGEQYPVFAVDQWSELQAAIEGRRCGIAVIDSAMLGKVLAKRISELERYSDRLVTLVAADRKDAQELIGFLSERKIHRLLIKPPALGITRLLLESAVSRCIQLRERSAARSAPEEEIRSTSAAVAAKVRGPRLPAWALAIALVSLLLGVAVVAGLSSFWGSGTPRAEQPAAKAAAAPAAADRFADLLARAERAFMEGRLADPPADNALDYYLTILAADPAHPLARDRLAMLVEALFSQAEAALLDDELDAAGAALASVRRADPTSGRLAFLDAQVARARSTASTAAVPTARTELDSLLAIAAARLARGQLLEPAGDSAREYIERAALLGPDDEGVLAARAELATALVAAARVVLDSGDLDGAARLLEGARASGADAEALGLVDIEVAGARSAAAQRRNSETLLAARQRLQTGALIEPANDSALDYLTALTRDDPSFAELPAAWSDLVGALAANTREALRRGDWAQADTWLAALARTERDPATTAALRNELQTGRLREQYLTTVAPASELQLLKYAPPVYPRDAQEDGVQGWVDLEFVVGSDGRPRDLRAVGAEPAGRFEQAAITAVAQYEYAPFTSDGQVYERRVHLQIRFVLQ